MGALATYGFITVYALVCVALPLHLRRTEKLTAGVMVLAAAGTIAMVLALAGSVYPVPTGAYAWLPYIYLVYLLAGFGWYVVGRREAA
jgi:amino acid transporter